MKITHKQSFFISLLLVFAVGCSSAPNKNNLLPDSGSTTQQIIQGGTRGDNSTYFGNGEKADYTGMPIAKGYSPSSEYSNIHVQELKRDFQRIPNPEIIGYIYSHLKDNDLPISGHYTTFKLYDKEHIGLKSEGHYGR